MPKKPSGKEQILEILRRRTLPSTCLQLSLHTGRNQSAVIDILTKLVRDGTVQRCKEPGEPSTYSAAKDQHATV